MHHTEYDREKKEICNGVCFNLSMDARKNKKEKHILPDKNNVITITTKSDQ